MKKMLVLIGLIVLSLGAVEATEVKPSLNNNQHIDRAAIRAQREIAFEQKLALTEEQKIKARELRRNGHAKLKPIMDEILSKKQEAKMIKMSRIAVEMQEEKLAVIDEELKVLEKKAHDIRKLNMKEFEAILSKDQKKILKQMKKEGRKKYKATHPCRGPLKTNI